MASAMDRGAVEAGRGASRAAGPDTLRRRMASRRSRMPKWLSHRRVVGVEVVLLVGVAHHVFERWIMDLGLPNWAETLFTMIGVIGAFSLLFAAVNALASFGVGQAHQAIKATPLPLPGLVIHLAALGGLFLLYAWLWDQWPPWG